MEQSSDGSFSSFLYRVSARHRLQYCCTSTLHLIRFLAASFHFHFPVSHDTLMLLHSYLQVDAIIVTFHDWGIPNQIAFNIISIISGCSSDSHLNQIVRTGWHNIPIFSNNSLKSTESVFCAWFQILQNWNRSTHSLPVSVLVVGPRRLRRRLPSATRRRRCPIPRGQLLGLISVINKNASRVSFKANNGA